MNSYRYYQLNYNDRNYPIYKRISPNSASTKSDGVIPYGSTVITVAGKIYNSKNIDYSTSLIAGTSLVGNLARIFLNGTTAVSGTFKLYVDVTYVTAGTSVIDARIPVAVINLK